MALVRIDGRTWTDGQLRVAVESEATWKGVASALGLAQSSTSRLKRHAVRLGLDTSHFTGRRRWSDRDLKAAVARSTSWSELLRCLDVSDTPETRTCIKGHAARLGLEMGRFNGARQVSASLWERLVAAEDVVTYLREAAESIAVAWFTLRRVSVAIPAEPMAYDLVAQFGSELQRVQVKSTAYRRQDGSWKAAIGHRPYVLDRTAETAPYGGDELDYYFIIDGDGSIFLIPHFEVAERASINVGAFMQHRVGTVSSLLGKTDSDYRT